MRLTICFGLLALALLSSSHVARAATVRASLATSPAGTLGNNGSSVTQFSFSADGTKVAFESTANTLVAGDTNGQSDIFVRDLATGTTTRVSVGSGGAQALGGNSYAPSLNADGTRVAFYSDATNLVAGDTNNKTDVFVRDLTTGTTTRVSLDSGGAQGNENSFNPSLSADGTRVAFQSFANTLVAGDTNGASDIFVRDLTAGTTTRVSVGSGGAQGDSDSYVPSLSADGTKVAFSSNATNLVAGDSNGVADVFVRDFTTNTTTRASVASGGAQSNDTSYNPSLSADGTKVAFHSNASTLVTSDTNNASDIFVRDLTTNTTTRASVDSGGAQGNSGSFSPSLSADGTKVAFYSNANNLVAGDTNGVFDIFVRDLTKGTTVRASVGSSGTQGNDTSYVPSLSADGSKVAFQSFARNLVAGDTNGQQDVFVRNLSTGNTAIVSVATSPAGAQGDDNSSSTQFSFSADGTEVAFVSLASNLVAGDTNSTFDVFVRDLTTGTTTRVSVASDGTQSNSNSFNASLSADGTKVAFYSFASNLVAGDTNGQADVFVRDLRTGTTTRVSVASDGTQGTGGDSVTPSLSADGSKVAFSSDATNLVAGDANGQKDVFVRDLTTGTTTLVSVDSGGTQSNGSSSTASLNADGTRVAFSSNATNLVAGDTNGVFDVFVRDLATGTTVRASVSNSTGAQSNNPSFNTSLSADGTRVAFSSNSSNLVAGDTNAKADVFVRDLTTGTTTLVSVDSGGAQGNGDSFSPSLSADGTKVAFQSNATNLVASDTNNRQDVFVRDLTTGTTVRASVDSGGAQGNGDSSNPSLSANGRKVAFQSSATNLVAGDTNNVSDVFVADVASVAVNALSIGDVTLNEGDNNTTDFVFTVTLSAASASDVTVDYTTANGTATAGSDYAATSGTLVFTPGQTSKTIVVAVAGDQGKEPNETFTVKLSNQNDATLAKATATGTITNDDSGLVVTTTSDAADNPNDNDNTLREAIGVANTNAGADTISFKIPGAGVQTIQLNSALPTLAGNGAATTINGYSQPGAKANTLATGSDAVLKIEIRGNGTSNFDGLTLASAGSTIKGLSIGNCRFGVYLSGAGATDNVVSGNYLGVKADGTTAFANNSGVFLNGAPNNTIGGTAAGARNLISGNSNYYGIYIIGAGATGNTVSGNYIGTATDGSSALANAYGVFISGAPNNTIGGTTAGARNVISGNSLYGVTIIYSGATGNVVSGNYIGANADGSAALANVYGVIINDAPNNTIGGTAAGARNVVSGNSYAGIFIGDPGATGNSVSGNFIGTTADGNAALANQYGVFISNAPNNNIGGTTAGERNVISGNSSLGVYLAGSDSTGNTLIGNYIGTRADGNIALGNNDGISISDAPNTIIGGDVAGARNVISGNSGHGVYIAGGLATGTQVSGNYVGVNADGSAALANLDGVYIAGAPNTTVGGDVAGARNVISGNTREGVILTDGVSTKVSGNYIGVAADGATARGNNIGIRILFASEDNTIGGTTAGERNVISGNTDSGVTIIGAEATRNTISGNFIGVKADGSSALANGTGVFISQAPGNTIGGTTASARNVISGNSGIGVFIGGPGATGNSVRGNSIFANGALGINLAGGNEDGNGVTANDAGDGDSGPNNLQNFPVLTTITSSGGNAVIKGTFNSNANKDYVLDFYDNAVADASGYGQGQTYLGSSTTITADGTDKTFTATLPGVTLIDGHFITATATRTSASDGTGALNDTSEFSLAVKFIANTAPVAAGQSATAVSGSPTNITLVATDADNDPLTYSVVAPPANGKVTIAGNVATYTSNFGYVGADSFTFKANDGKADSNTATVNINVIAGPAPPESGLVVTTLSDVQASDGVTSLREAVDAANRDGKDSAITFAVSGTITLTGGELTLVNDGKVSITGPSAGVTIVGDGKSRVFNINGADATLSGLNITGGNAGNANGGAILNNGALTLNGSTLFNNAANSGGAIANGGALILINTTLANNSAQNNGGGIFNAPTATLSSLNSTIVGNAATSDGGLFKGKSLTLSNSIVVGNTSDNLSAVADAGGSNITSGTNAAAGLDPSGLRDNGGPVRTIALTTRGTAVNTGDNAAAASLTTDGRGAGFPRVVSGKVDIGAFESAFGNRAPSLNNATFSTSANVPFSMQLTGSDADGDSLSYSRAGGTLPDGITLSSTGLLAGTPTKVGRYDFQINVNDGTDTTVARFILIVSANDDGVGPVITRSALSPSYTRDEFANIVYRGTVRDVAPGGVTPSGVAQVTFQLRRNSDGFAYSGDESTGFTSNVNLGYFPAFLSEPTPNTAAARDYRRTFGANGFVPSASVLTPGGYSLVIAAKDVAGNFSVEVVPVSITAATSPIRATPATSPASPSAPSAIRSGAGSSAGAS